MVCHGAPHPTSIALFTLRRYYMYNSDGPAKMRGVVAKRIHHRHFAGFPSQWKVFAQEVGAARHFCRGAVVTEDDRPGGLSHQLIRIRAPRVGPVTGRIAAA